MLAISGTDLPNRAPMRRKLVALPRRFDEQHVGAGVAIERGARHGAIETLDGDGVGAGDDERVARACAHPPPP